MFSWLVTIVLTESAQKVGVAQMSLLVPATLLLLVGGSLADHFGGRRVAALAQSSAVLPPFFLVRVLGALRHSAALLPPFFLIVVLAAQSLTFDAMIVYAVAMGIAQAFVTPG